MHAGGLRHRISIQKKVTTSDDSTEGIPVDNWVEVIKTWVEAIPLGGKEAFIAQATQGDNPYMFKMRYKIDTTILNTMRIVYLEQNFKIININDVDGRHIELWITCNQDITNG